MAEQKSGLEMASNEFASIVQGWESVPAALWERLIAGFEEPASLAKWLSSPLHWISDHFELAGLGVLIATGGELEICARDGDLPKLLPAEFFMSVLDSSKIEIQSPWIASPLPANFEPNSLLVGWMGSMSNEQSKNHSKWSAGRVSEFRTHSQALGDALAIWKLCKHQRDAIAQRDKIIEVATSWHHHRALPDLLQKMAEAAASLLDSDRASIFLWDKPARQLVGYPALGVEGNPLRIPDDSGIAGRVLKSIQSERWDRSDRTDKVDRTVDEKTGYRTDSIVAVPLVDENAKAIGVFEVLNQRSGRFTVAHEHLLADFARHASTALANLQHIQKLIATRDRLTKNLASQSPLLGNAPAMMKLKETISRVADTDLAVLILGENGSGKEVVSRQIHYLSRRRHEIFVAVNCAAITESLLESELFGHEKGAFTDAIETRLGKFETASGGTLLLDEIGDMSLKGQAKLLRVLEEKVVVRVGGSVRKGGGPPAHPGGRAHSRRDQSGPRRIGSSKAISRGPLFSLDRGKPNRTSSSQPRKRYLGTCGVILANVLSQHRPIRSDLE